MFIIHVISDTQCVPYIFGEGVLAVQFLQMSKVFFFNFQVTSGLCFYKNISQQRERHSSSNMLRSVD
jgi:hypothetical protein